MAADTYEIGKSSQGYEYIRCRVCKSESYHPEDVERKFCARCNAFHPISQNAVCGSCNGTGKNTEGDKCKRCKGSGVL